MNQQREIMQDEISISELIEMIWKGKWIIAIVTIIAILASSIANFFILPEKYAATASLSIKPITLKMATLDNTLSFVDYLAIMPIKTKADYLEQVKSDQVLENTIETLGLKDDSGHTLSVSGLRNMITVTDKATAAVLSDRITVTINSTDPQRAALIANTLSQEFQQVVADDWNAQTQSVSDSIAKQLSDGEAVLSEKTILLNDYRSENIDIDVLKAETSNLINQIAQYQTDLQEIETQIASDTAALQVLENISQSTDIVKSEDFNLSIDTGTDAETPNVIVPPDSLQDSLLTIKINTIQTQLITNIAKKDTLGNRIPDLESTLTDSQITLTEQGYKYDTVLKDMEIAKQTYQAYQQRSREVLTYSSSDIGKSIVWLSSEAQIPKEPDSPKKIKNIAIAGMLGFSLSMFFVLFQNYLKRTKVVPSK